MTATPPNSSNAQPEDNLDTIALLQSLRRKEGNWINWGQKCQQLQKAGYTPQQIFEDTGFEPSQQNQIIVAAQVYSSMDEIGMPDVVRSRFEQTGSDTLYELRILTQPERVAAATLIVEKGIDSEGSRDIAKALKDFSRFKKLPSGFENHPGDAVAYHYWKLARQQAELQSRSRLIAQALRFAQSETARQQIEKLLVDFSVTKSRPAPRMPYYRLDSDDQLPRVIPVVGKLPLTLDDFKAVPFIEEEGQFHIVKSSGPAAWVAMPGWQVVHNADDPVGILVNSNELPEPLPEVNEEVLLLIDRADRHWDSDAYFLIEKEAQLQLHWSEDAPDQPLLGRLLLILRPKKVLDENYIREAWQVDE